MYFTEWFDKQYSKDPEALFERESVDNFIGSPLPHCQEPLVYDFTVQLFTEFCTLKLVS